MAKRIDRNFLLESLQDTYRDNFLKRYEIDSDKFKRFLYKESKRMMDVLWDRVNIGVDEIKISVTRQPFKKNIFRGVENRINFFIASELADFFAEEIGDDRVVFLKEYDEYTIIIRISPQYLSEDGGIKKNEFSSFINKSRQCQTIKTYLTISEKKRRTQRN